MVETNKKKLTYNIQRPFWKKNSFKFKELGFSVLDMVTQFPNIQAHACNLIGILERVSIDFFLHS